MVRVSTNRERNSSLNWACYPSPPPPEVRSLPWLDRWVTVRWGTSEVAVWQPRLAAAPPPMIPPPTAPRPRPGTPATPPAGAGRPLAGGQQQGGDVRVAAPHGQRQGVVAGDFFYDRGDGPHFLRSNLGAKLSALAPKKRPKMAKSPPTAGTLGGTP